MKIIYYFKNIKLPESVKEVLLQKLSKVKKFFKKEEALVEVEIEKSRSAKYKEGLYKTKIILDLPKKALIVVTGVGKNMFQAIENSFRKLKRKLKR